MQRVADEAGVAPTRISFIAALHLICNEWNWLAVTKPGAIHFAYRSWTEPGAR